MKFGADVKVGSPPADDFDVYRIAACEVPVGSGTHVTAC
jgi:hypothetical protein